MGGDSRRNSSSDVVSTVQLFILTIYNGSPQSSNDEYMPQEHTRKKEDPKISKKKLLPPH